MIILDTSIIIEILKETELGSRIANRLGGHELAITSFTVHELMVGVREKDLAKVSGFLSLVNVKVFDSIAAFESSRLERQLTSKGKIIGSVDIFIASICFASNAKLVTLDRDFEKIDDLDLEIPV